MKDARAVLDNNIGGGYTWWPSLLPTRDQPAIDLFISNHNKVGGFSDFSTPCEYIASAYSLFTFISIPQVNYYYSTHYNYSEAGLQDFTTFFSNVMDLSINKPIYLPKEISACPSLSG